MRAILDNLSLLFCADVIRVDDFAARSVKGKHAASFLREISDVSKMCGIKKIKLGITSDKKVLFSRDIDESKRQRFRNVICSSFR